MTTPTLREAAERAWAWIGFAALSFHPDLAPLGAALAAEEGRERVNLTGTDVVAQPWQRIGPGLISLPTPQERIDALTAEVAALRAALDKINALRNSIIGFQQVSWSDHVYPLVAVLNAAGFTGKEYEAARADATSLIEELASLRAERDALTEERDRWMKRRDGAIKTIDGMRLDYEAEHCRLLAAESERAAARAEVERLKALLASYGVPDAPTPHVDAAMALLSGKDAP